MTAAITKWEQLQSLTHTELEESIPAARYAACKLDHDLAQQILARDGADSLRQHGMAGRIVQNTIGAADPEFKHNGLLTTVALAQHAMLAHMGYRYLYAESISPLTHPRFPQPNLPLLIHPFQFEFPPGSGKMSLKFDFKSPLPGADSSIVTSVSELYPLRAELIPTLQQLFHTYAQQVRFSSELDTALRKYGFKPAEPHSAVHAVSEALSKL
jgi:hypothetical protein